MERTTLKCIVLGAVDTGEADRVVSLFSEERGRISAFAAHAKKSVKRFGGALEPFTLVNAALTERRGELYRFERADILEPFTGIRDDLHDITRASYACELVREVCHEREPHPELFGELVDLLFRFSKRTSTPEDLLVFELRALGWAGLRPTLDACAGCGAAPSPEDRFDADIGGLICPQCARRVPGARALSRDAGDALRALQDGVRDPLATEPRREARRHLERFIAHHLGKPLKTVEFMRSLGIE
jgi:DNA repair protein RecO (recombination protein O)